MSDRITVGIDNGSSGTIGIITPSGVTFQEIPTLDYLHYGQRGTISKRLDRYQLNDTLERKVGLPFVAGDPFPDKVWVGFDNIHVFIERPFTGQFMNVVLPAHRFFEATICVLEDYADRHGLGYTVVDSREWQKPVLGAVKTSAALKLASKLRGIQLYPQFRDAITRHGDADGLLIAHHFHHRA